MRSPRSTLSDLQQRSGTCAATKTALEARKRSRDFIISRKQRLMYSCGWMNELTRLLKDITDVTSYRLRGNGRGL